MNNNCLKIDLKKVRIDHQIISQIIPSKAKVLDLGCGNGSLLYLLKESKHIDGRGIELTGEGVKESIAKGLSVIQGNLEEMVGNYPAKAFDYCILSQTLHELKRPDYVFAEMLRISKHSLVSFYNLAYYKYRFQILFQGHFPKSKDLPYDFMNTNIIFLSVKDFQAYCTQNGIKITQAFCLADHGLKPVKFWANLRSNLCIMEISKE